MVYLFLEECKLKDSMKQQLFELVHTHSQEKQNQDLGLLGFECNKQSFQKAMLKYKLHLILQLL
jgi:hypothetical protein